MVEPIHTVLSRAMEGDADSILLIFAVYIVLVCKYSLIYQLRVMRWPSTRGNLLYSRVEHVSGFKWNIPEKQYAADALYEYKVNGETYRGRKVSPWAMVTSHNVRFILERQLRQIEVGDDGTVKVYYNARKPARALLIKPGVPGLVITVALGLAPMALYVLR
ncbi:MAG: DUF3592 domain-containing protein [Pseudomonadota bacterium]